MSVRRKNKGMLYFLAALLTAALLFAVALAVGRARMEKSAYISAAEGLALLDLGDAVKDMSAAMREGDACRLNRAAGRAEAYLSRAGLGDCSGAYRTIGGICSGEYGDDACERLSEAVGKAIGGDGGTALRKLNAPEDTGGEESGAETEEDRLSLRVLERLGRGKDDLALGKAVSFACPNAAFDICSSEGCGKNCFKYSGDNVFVSIEGDRQRVTMYCFEREVDERYLITQAEAEEKIRALIEREKLSLPCEGQTVLEDGVYKCVFTEDGKADGEALVAVEIYSDTGRLRKYDAVNYYGIKG